MDFDIHMGSEDAGGNIVSHSPKLIDEIIYQGFGLFGARGVGVRRPSSFPCIAVERKLGDDKDFTIDVGQCGVHFAIFVIKNAQAGDFSSQPLRFSLAVAVGDAEQDHKAFADTADYLIVDGYGSVGDSLN